MHVYSVYVSLGFEWVNPVLSSFEDWVMGWENETGRMDYKFFWGVEGAVSRLSRVGRN